jgi:uncharacterized protein YyaL (SSP411 family)
LRAAVPGTTQRGTTSATTRGTPAFFLLAAKEVTEHIQKHYWDPTTGLYAHSLDDRRPDAMWGNGVMFSALVAAAKHDPRVYHPILSRFFDSLERYWDIEAKPPGYEPWPTHGGGNDKYYDDNEWMVLTFLDAYELTREEKYLVRADAALRFSLSGWDDALGGGIWWHEQHKDGTKNTCSNAPAAVACLRMAEHRRRAENIAWARKIVAWTNEHLQDTDGLFFDRKKVATGALNRDKLTYNTALMLRANLKLHRLTDDKHYLDEAKRIAAACEWFVGKETGAYRDHVKFAHLLVEADLEYHRATSDQRVLSRAQRNGEVAYARWKANPTSGLIANASVARMLWVLAEQKPPRRAVNGER